MDLALEMSANEHVEEPLPDPIVWRPTPPSASAPGRAPWSATRSSSRRARAGAFKPRPVPGLGQARARRSPLPARALAPAGRRGADAAGPPPRGGGGGRTLPEDADPGLHLARRQDAGAAGRGAHRRARARPRATSTGRRRSACSSPARARPSHTYARPNRRFPGRVGEVPGRTYSPRVLAQPTLLVGHRHLDEHDAGASWSRWRGSSRGLAEHARVTVAECDVEIARVYPFEGAVARGGGPRRDRPPPGVRGAFLGARKVDGVVYFTDGEGPSPRRRRGCPCSGC